MQYFGVKGGYFCCFFKGDDVDVFCCWCDVWVGSIDFWDIGLDIDVGGIQCFVEQSGGIIVVVVVEGGGVVFCFVVDKVLGYYQVFCQVWCQLLLGQFGDGGDVWFGVVKVIVSVQYFMGVKLLCLNIVFMQNFYKQQGRYQFVMVDQFVSQGG